MDEYKEYKLKKKKRRKIVIVLILIAGIGLLLTSFLPYLPYLFLH